MGLIENISFAKTPGVTPREIVESKTTSGATPGEIAGDKTAQRAREAASRARARETRAARVAARTKSSGSGMFDIMTDEEAARARARAAASQAKLGQTVTPSGGGAPTTSFGSGSSGGGGGSWGSLQPYTRIVQSAPSTTSTAAGPSVSREALAALGKAKEQYQPGGGYGAGLEAALGRGAKKSIAAGTQSLVSAGLASTSMGAGLGKQYEEEVATPARADLESRRAVALSGLETLEAQMQQGGSQAEMDRSLALQQQQTGLSYGAAEGVASRSAQLRQQQMQISASTAEAAAQRSFTSGQASLNRQFQLQQMEASQAPTAGQHITSSTGVSSFLQNLRSQDIMSAPDWNFGS